MLWAVWARFFNGQAGHGGVPALWGDQAAWAERVVCGQEVETIRVVRGVVAAPSKKHARDLAT